MPKASKHGRAEVLEPYRHNWTPSSTEPAAHPNSRFTTPAAQCPIIASEWQDPAGVPIAAILFGGRRASQYRSSWSHSPGRTVSFSAHASRRRRPPRPRGTSASCATTRSQCCPSAATTWATTSGTGSRSAPTPTPPNYARIYYVNWFGKDTDWQLAMAGIRREQPRAEMDHRTPRRPRRGGAQRDRQPAHAGVLRRERDGPRRPAPPTPAQHRPPRMGPRGSALSRTTLPPSAPTCPHRYGTNTTPS